MAAWTPSLLSVLRVVAGFLFMMHGTQKLFGFPAPMPGNPAELPPLMLAAGSSKAWAAFCYCWACSRGRLLSSFQGRWRSRISKPMRRRDSGRR